MVHQADVNASSSVCGFHDEVGDILRLVVDQQVGAEIPGPLQLVVAAGGGRHPATGILGELQGGAADTACHGFDQYPPAGLHFGHRMERVPGRQPAHRDGCAFDKGEVFGQVHQVFGVEQHLLSMAATGPAKNTVTGLEAFHPFTRLEHNTRALHAHHEGQFLTAVVPGTHARFGEVDATGVNLDEDLARTWPGRGQILPQHGLQAAEFSDDKTFHIKLLAGPDRSVPGDQPPPRPPVRDGTGVNSMYNSPAITSGAPARAA